jgi:hypothetical protein
MLNDRLPDPEAKKGNTMVTQTNNAQKTPVTAPPRKRTAPPTPLLLALADRVEQSLPIFLSTDTYNWYKQTGVSKGELQRAVNWLCAQGRARLEAVENGTYVHPAQATAQSN